MSLKNNTGPRLLGETSIAKIVEYVVENIASRRYQIRVYIEFQHSECELTPLTPSDGVYHSFSGLWAKISFEVHHDANV